ncbi:MAG TPA: methyltransferase domain-containing protein [Chloroflexia bacterium]|nr:methyltransferase domain-containing protein [Chloroflexia bacterium]
MTDFVMPKSDFTNAEIASVYDELSFWSSRFGALLFSHIRLQRDLNILDLGCGTGFPTFELAHLYGSSCHVTGVDIWKEALDRARAKLAVYGLQNVSIVEADGAQLPFGTDEFDLIVSNLGVNNFENPAAAFSECFRVAKPSGRIVLTTNVRGHMREFYDVFRETLAGKAVYLERLEANEAHRGTKESHSHALQVAGFRVTRAIEDAFQMRYADANALLNHSLTRIGFLGGWRSVVEPEDEVEIFAEVARRLDDIADAQGELVMTVPMLYLEGEKPQATRQKHK